MCKIRESQFSIQALAAAAPVSKVQIKDAMNKGAVWLQRGRKTRRLRRAKAMLKVGDTILFYHDPDLLKRNVVVPQLLQDMGHYSVWIKPAGLLAQGTQYGDHCSLLRQVELWAEPKRQVFLIHRLDREAVGLMVVAHQKETAAWLSDLFIQQTIEKKYRIQVKGRAAEEAFFDDMLDQKSAVTAFKRMSYDQHQDISTVDVCLHGGRYHQIRRHFDMNGLPLMGDPRYGQHNQNKTGLALCAYRLAFTCPQTKVYQQFEMPNLPF